PGAVAEILEDDRILGQHLAVLEPERGDRALGIDLEVGASVLERLALEVHLRGIMLDARLVQQDMRRLRACAGGIIESHHARAPHSEFVELPTSFTSGLS